MPYATNADLPPSVRNRLPPHAQDIFRAAFNRAFTMYGETIAFRVAWAAVKRSYMRMNGTWMPRWEI